MNVHEWHRVKAIRLSGLLLLQLVVLLGVSAACSATSASDRELERVDAEVFESVVRAEIPGSVDSIGPPGFLRVDSRPAGDNSTLKETDRPPALDLEGLGDSTSGSALAAITDQRRAILGLIKVEEGGPFVYPGCGGIRSRRTKAGVPIGKCPAEWRRYVTVGLPYHGVATVINKVRRAESPEPDSTGDVWTVLVTESSVGPGGQDWRQYAWLVRRDPLTNRLGLVDRYLLSWAE
ncbi:MAG: hypothetical protein ABR585_11015 [Gemmatimonadaceae bacterium]